MNDELPPPQASRTLLLAAAIDLLEQETPTARPVREAGEFRSLLRASYSEELGCEMIEETEIDPPIAERLLRGDPVSLEECESAGTRAREARANAFGADGGFMLSRAQPPFPIHLPNPFDDTPLPLPIRALYAIGAILSTEGRLLIGEGVAAFNCLYRSTPDASQLGPASGPVSACGFNFDLVANAKFSRVPHPVDLLPLRCSGEYLVRIRDITDPSVYDLLAHKVKFEATSHTVLQWEKAIQIGPAIG